MTPPEERPVVAMHDCPCCGEVCDCDGEDTWVSWPYNRDCEHQCPEPEDEDYEEEAARC